MMFCLNNYVNQGLIDDRPRTEEAIKEINDPSFKTGDIVEVIMTSPTKNVLPYSKPKIGKILEVTGIDHNDFAYCLKDEENHVLYVPAHCLKKVIKQ